MFEHLDSGPEATARPLPEGFDEIAGAVQCECEQVQCEQDAGQGVLAMAVVVFEVVSIVLESGFIKPPFSDYGYSRSSQHHVCSARTVGT